MVMNSIQPAAAICFWLSVSGVRCLLTLNTLETLPCAQIGHQQCFWLQFITQHKNEREKLNHRRQDPTVRVSFFFNQFIKV